MRGDAEYANQHQHGAIGQGKASSGAHLPANSAKHWWNRTTKEGGTAPHVEAAAVEAPELTLDEALAEKAEEKSEPLADNA